MEKLIDITNSIIELEGLAMLLEKKKEQRVLDLMIDKAQKIEQELREMGRMGEMGEMGEMGRMGDPGSPEEPTQEPAAVEPTQEPAPAEPTPEPAPSIMEALAAQTDTVRVEEAVSLQNAQDFSKAFTLNDKYRFIRELFNGSQEKFAYTLQLVESMPTLDKAYDYFLNELEWDADNPDVSDFLGIVANHFNAAS